MPSTGRRCWDIFASSGEIKATNEQHRINMATLSRISHCSGENTSKRAREEINIYDGGATRMMNQPISQKTNEGGALYKRTL